MTSQAFLTAKYGSYIIGQEQGFASLPADPRWIKRDGSVIAQANYPALFEVYYCGDDLNATADFGYRCTDPLDPDNTRDTAGTYVALENADGRFDRSVVPGGSRDLWSYEEDQMQQITGEIGRTGSNALTTDPGNGALQSGTSRGDIGTTSNVAGYTIKFDSANSPGARVGDETRPKNSAKIPMIFTG